MGLTELAFPEEGNEQSALHASARLNREATRSAKQAHDAYKQAKAASDEAIQGLTRAQRDLAAVQASIDKSYGSSAVKHDCYQWAWTALQKLLLDKLEASANSIDSWLEYQTEPYCREMVRANNELRDVLELIIDGTRRSSHD